MTVDTQKLRQALQDLVRFHDNGSGIRYSYDKPEWEEAANPLAVRALLAENDALRAELQAAANYIDALGGDSKKYRVALNPPAPPQGDGA